MRGSPGSITGHIEEADCLVVVAVVGGANRQENPNSDVQLQPSDCTSDLDLHLDEGVVVESQGLEGGEAEDVNLGPVSATAWVLTSGEFVAWPTLVLHGGWAVGLWTLRCA